MKVLIDENLPHELRRELQPHDVFTVQYQGWSGLKNGELLVRAAATGFDVMITMDSGVLYQQSSLPLAVIVLKAASNDMDDLRPLIPSLLEALRTISGRNIVEIGD